MKVFLDDCRNPLNRWVRTYTPKETIEFLKTGDIEKLSLDHDLGDDDGIGTGYNVLLWIEEQVVINTFTPPIIIIHSSNSSARLKMNAAIEQIYRLEDKLYTKAISSMKPREYGK